MKIAIIGSRNLTVNDIGKYLPEGVTEIVSGGAREYAKSNHLKLTEDFQSGEMKIGNPKGLPIHKGLSIF